MQNQEIKEWREKEQEIKREHNNRINLLENVLIEREKIIDKKARNKIQKKK